MSAAERAKPLTAAEADRIFHAFFAFDAVLLAVSGGPDSTALLVLMAKWRERMQGGPKLVAATVDHGLRKESGREARQVAALAGRLKVEHHILRWSGRKPKTGLQEAARLARYRLLSKLGLDANASHIVTAHTLDDQAETLLMRMARGTGISGLSGMSLISPVPVAEGRALLIARPLLEIPKARLVATLKAAKIPYAKDPSNENPRFTRTRIRALMPALAREGLTAERLGLLARRVARAEDAFFQIVNDAQSQLVHMLPEEGPIRFSAEAFERLPDEIAMRVLGRMIRWVGRENPENIVELAKLEALGNALCHAIATAWMGFDHRFRRTLAGALVTLDGKEVVVERAPPRRAGGGRRISALTKAEYAAGETGFPG